MKRVAPPHPVSEEGTERASRPSAHPGAAGSGAPLRPSSGSSGDLRALVDSTRLTADSTSAEEHLITGGVLCLLGLALTHLLDLGGHTADAPYIAVLFGSLALTALVLATLLARRKLLSLVWPAVGVLAFTAMMAYLYSRTVGLPQIEGHVGDWRDPLGTASLVFEALLVAFSLPRLRLRALRIAPAATLISVGLIVSAALTGRGGHHDHAQGAGHMHAGMNVDTATPQQQAWGRDHLRQAHVAAKQRFPTFEAARAAGYEFLPQSYAAQKDLTFWHLTDPRTNDRDHLNPRRPESLMYWNNPRGKPKLVAFVYRIPRKARNQPQEPGPLFSWHVHRSPGGLAKRKMVHLWLLDDIRDAFSPEVPFRQLARKYGTPEEGGTGSGLD